MPRSFSFSLQNLPVKDPRMAARVVVGTLLLANVVAALIAFHPWGGSPEDLARQSQQLGQQVLEMQTRLAASKALVAKVEGARTQGDAFLAQYVTDRRITSSTILAELDRVAQEAGIKAKEKTFNLEPVEGSETLTQMTITAGYEGSYASLTKFVNLIDKSQRFLIIENMAAAPQQNGQTLNVSFRMDTFIREAPGSESLNSERSRRRSPSWEFCWRLPRSCI